MLNTEARISASYLVLHRARCRTINRELAPGRTWTDLDAKICDGDRTVIEEWAFGRTGANLKPCGVYRTGGRPSSPTKQAVTMSGGLQVEMKGEPVRVRGESGPRHGAHQPPRIIDGAQWLAETYSASA